MKAMFLAASLGNFGTAELTNTAPLLSVLLFQFRHPAFQREFANIAPNDSDQSSRQQERRRQECDDAVGDWPMGQAPPHRRNGKLSPIRRDIEETNADEADVGALMKENAELRQLVIQLSELVIRNVMLHR